MEVDRVKEYSKHKSQGLSPWNTASRLNDNHIDYNKLFSKGWDMFRILCVERQVSV